MGWGRLRLGDAGNVDHVPLGALDALLDGGRHFQGLAEAEAHLAVAVAHDHQRAEGEVLAPLHDLGDAANVDDLVLHFALLVPALGSGLGYGSCPERAQAYQERYERSQRSQDLVCYQKALERELNGQNGYSCPNSSQHYQNAYRRNQRSSDLVCFQKALERELQ